MSKNTLSTADYQTSPTSFGFEPVGGKKIVVDFMAPELSSLGGLTLVREYERSSCRILDRIESCIKDPRNPLLTVHGQPVMIRQRFSMLFVQNVRVNHIQEIDGIRLDLDWSVEPKTSLLPPFCRQEQT